MRALAIAMAAAATAWAAPTVAQAACGGDTDCSGGPARVMLIVDASSDMLNGQNGAGAMGTTNWDTLTAFLSSPLQSPWEANVAAGGPFTSHVVHFGLTVVGDVMPAPGEQKIAVEYAPCSKPNAVWATAPSTSCVDPGCTDPWSGPPITWTFIDGVANDPPGFATPTVSHMPRCDNGPGGRCDGSERHVDLAIDLVTDHVATYRTTTDFKVSDSTMFANVLLLIGAPDSDSAATQAALERAYAAGITTYVIGLGAEAGSAMVSGALDALAGWGSGGTQTATIAQNQGELFAAMQSIIDGVALPCCGRIDCSSAGGAGDDSGTGGDDANDTWGSASGSGSASDSADGDASMSGGSATGATAGDTDSEGAPLDDDGGCTCRADDDQGRSALWAGVVLAALGRRRRQRPRT